MTKIIKEIRIRGPNQKALEGMDKDLIRQLKETPNLSISYIQKVLDIGYERASRIYEIVNGHKEHKLGNWSFLEMHFTDEKLCWWTEFDAALFDLGDFGAESIEKEKKIINHHYVARENRCNLLTFPISSPNKPLRHYILVQNGTYNPNGFMDYMRDVANAYNNCEFYILSYRKALITKINNMNQTPYSALTLQNFDKLLGVSDKVKVMTYFPQGAGRMFYGFLFEEKYNERLERSNIMGENFKIYESIVGKFKILQSVEEMKPYFEELENAYVFYENVFLNFDINDKSVNIKGRCIRARELKLRNIEAPEGLFADRLECKMADCDFIIVNTGITCENLKCQVVKTSFLYGITQQKFIENN